MTSYLLPEEELKRIHQQASKYRCPPEERVRLFCIYWAGMGKKVEWIHDMLFLPERTIYNYLQEYAAQKKQRMMTPLLQEDPLSCLYNKKKS